MFVSVRMTQTKRSEAYNLKLKTLAIKSLRLMQPLLRATFPSIAFNDRSYLMSERAIETLLRSLPNSIPHLPAKSRPIGVMDGFERIPSSQLEVGLVESD